MRWLYLHEQHTRCTVTQSNYFVQDGTKNHAAKSTEKICLLRIFWRYDISRGSSPITIAVLQNTCKLIIDCVKSAANK